MFNAILPRMCEQDQGLRISLLVPCGAHAVSTHERILRVPELPRNLRPSRVWQHITPSADRLLRYFATDSGTIWHSTYYTLPVRKAAKTVITVYDMIHERYPNLFSKRLDDNFRMRKKLAIERADAVICISETTRSDLERFYGTLAKHVTVIPLGFDRDVFKPLELSDGIALVAHAVPFLLYIGSRAPHKNFGTLLQAYSTWSTRNHVDLVVVGGPWEPHEEQVLRSRGVSDRVRLLSGVSDLELSRLYCQAEALVLPSLYEGFGIPILEAMACGCPIVASRIPSTIEVAGDCPFYFEPTSEESLRGALDAALRQGRASSNVALGLRLCRSYSWEKTASRILEVYHALSAPE